MTREEQIKQKAHEISQMCFPDSQNIWARPNIEAQRVQSVCCEMVRWADENPKEGLISIDKACEYLKHNLFNFGSEQNKTWNENIEIFINKFKSAMENKI